MNKTIDNFDERADFSLVLGGPLFQLLRRSRLSGDTLELLNRRIIIMSLLAWLPLLILSVLEGQALGGRAAVPFLQDIDVHVRFLLALPLFIQAELVVHQRMRPTVKEFLKRNLIPGNSMTKFDAAVASAFRLRNSVLAEAIMIVLVYVLGYLIWRKQWALDTNTWYATSTAGGSKLSFAGIWYGYISLPLFQFLMVRWFYRIFIWARFLWQVSRIDLVLVPTHPDRVGGLGFLSQTVDAYMPLAVAFGTLLAGVLANRIFYLGTSLRVFQVDIAVLVVFLLVMMLGPLLVFSSQLYRANLRGIREYGTLAERYVSEFDTKWLRGGAPAGEPLVGSGDIQSLADMANSYEVVRKMRIIPVENYAIIMLVVATLAPVAPLVLTMMPLDELLKNLLGILF